MMMFTRRKFLLAGASVGLGAVAYRFNLGLKKQPEYWLMSACSNHSNEHFIAAFDLNGVIKNKIKLPARGHDAIAITNKPGHAIVFARRPGMFAYEVDLIEGRVIQEITPAKGSHFYGHGVLSAKHNVLYTTENSYESGEGRIVVRDADNYQILDSYSSGGIGPHQLAIMPNSDDLVIANGGIRTHPDQPRKKLNLDSMLPNLAYLDATTGQLIDSYAIDTPKLSIRHLDVSKQGKVIAGLQYQGAKSDLVPLAISHHGESSLQYLKAPESTWRSMRQYTASVCIDSDKQVAAISCPRANMITYWSLLDNSYLSKERFSDGAGLTFANQMYVSSGKGKVIASTILNNNITEAVNTALSFDGLKWDNHLSHLKIV